MSEEKADPPKQSTSEEAIAALRAWQQVMDDEITRTYHFLHAVQEEQLVIYDKLLEAQIAILLKDVETPTPTAISIIRSKREFVRLLMFLRSEVMTRCPRPDETAKESLNDEYLAFLMRRQPEQ